MVRCDVQQDGYIRFEITYIVQLEAADLNNIIVCRL
jgi:hypothetical protein